MEAQLLQYSDEPFIPREMRRKRPQERADERWKRKPLAESVRLAFQHDLERIYERPFTTYVGRAEDFKGVLDTSTLRFLGDEFLHAPDPASGARIFTPKENLGVQIIVPGAAPFSLDAWVKSVHKGIIRDLDAPDIDVQLSTTRQLGVDLDLDPEEAKHVGPDDYWLLITSQRYEGAGILVHQDNMSELSNALFVKRQTEPDTRFSFGDLVEMARASREEKQIPPSDTNPDLESEMPLNQQDLDNIVAAVKKSGVATSWKQTLTLCATIAVFSIGCVAWWTTRLDRVDDKLGDRLDKIEATLKEQGPILSRLDERTKWIISTGSHSSTPPTTTSGSPTP